MFYFIIIIIIIIFFFAAPCGVWDLSSLTRDQTRGSGDGSAEP